MIFSIPEPQTAKECDQDTSAEMQVFRRISFCTSAASASKEKTWKIRISGTRHLVCIVVWKHTDIAAADIPFQKDP
jgi:hypothetical protein